jgi:hypothetical protein
MSPEEFMKEYERANRAHDLERVRSLIAEDALFWFSNGGSRRRMRFSASSCARLVNRDRIASNSRIRSATVGRFHYQTATRASSRIRFSGGRRSSFTMQLRSGQGSD